MNGLWLSLVFWLFLPTLMCKAEAPLYNKTHDNPTQQNLDFIDIHFGFSSLSVHTGPTQEVKINHQSQQKAGASFSLVRSAEAADFTPETFEKICETIRNAGQLDDLKAVLTDGYFQVLKAKVTAGASQYVVLTMLQEMRPQNIRVMDTLIQGDKAELAVVGQSYLGPMQGLVHLVKTEGVWKVENENWNIGGKNPQHTKDPIAATFNTLSLGNKYDFAKSSGVLKGISPEYALNRNFLSLAKVSNNRRKQAIMFVFLMNRDKAEAERLRGLDQQPKFEKLTAHLRARMHVLWTGPKKMLPEQKVIENKYPVDVSIAKYEDGYAPGEWNLVLPGKKPREVRVSFLWSF